MRTLVERFPMPFKEVANSILDSMSVSERRRNRSILRTVLIIFNIILCQHITFSGVTYREQ